MPFVRTLTFYVKGLFFLAFGIGLFSMSLILIKDEARYLLLNGRLESLYKNNAASELEGFEKDFEKFNKPPSFFSNPKYLQTLAYYQMRLARSYPENSPQAMDRKERAIDLQKRAIEASPLKSYLWLDLAYFYREVKYPPKKVVAALYAAHKIAPFSPYYMMSRIKIYLDYWEYLPQEMRDDMMVIINKFIQEQSYAFIPGLKEIRYARAIQRLYVGDEETWKKIDGNIGFYTRAGKLR